MGRTARNITTTTAASSVTNDKISKDSDVFVFIVSKSDNLYETINTKYIQNGDKGLIATKADDIIIVRKDTSDGSFLPTNINYDTVIKGGDLAYSNATGLNPEDIKIDGDGFTTPTNSKGPEELVPGWVQDSVDITVYERPTVGASHIVSRNYIGDGTTTIFDIGTAPITESSLFVKVNNSINLT